MAIASCTLWLITGLFGAWHQASVPHGRDLTTQAWVHGSTTACRDASPSTHIHELPAQDDHDTASCQLIASAKPTTTPRTIPNLAVLIAIRIFPPPSRRVVVQPVALLDVAPKTSPPHDA